MPPGYDEAMPKPHQPRKPGRPTLPDAERLTPRTIRARDEEWWRWSEAADRAGLSLAAWVRKQLDAAARRR